MPPARQSDHALSVAREVAEGLAGEGAEAVVLVGSNARGDAGPDSDVDLLAVRPKMFSFRLERHGGLLISVSSRPPEAYRREMADPGSVGTAVPGWREAMVLHDPEGMARSLIEEAEAWTWEPVERRCDSWVAEKITSLAEEVHKLVEAIRIGHNVTAAVQRSVLAVRLAQILAVPTDGSSMAPRIVSGTSSQTPWVEEWRRTPSAAFGLHGERFEETRRAALRLYSLAAEETHSLLDERQRRVVRHARELGGLADG